VSGVQVFEGDGRQPTQSVSVEMLPLFAIGDEVFLDEVTPHRFICSQYRRTDRKQPWTFEDVCLSYQPNWLRVGKHGINAVSYANGPHQRGVVMEVSAWSFKLAAVDPDLRVQVEITGGGQVLHGLALALRNPIRSSLPVNLRINARTERMIITGRVVSVIRSSDSPEDLRLVFSPT
jgi:hypothetical protein